MRKLLAAMLLAAASIAIIGGSAFAADGPNGTINGTLVNKTAGGASVAGLEVSLAGYKGTEEAVKKTAKAGPDGKFRFEALETAAGYQYQLTVTFQDAAYYSDPVTFGAAGDTSTDKTVEMPVLDATTDASVLKTAAHHYVIDPDTTGVAVTEMVIVTNSSDKAYIGSSEAHAGAKATLRFTLPQGATDFQPVDGLFPGKTLQIDGGFVDTLPVFPGMAQKVWEYRIPATGDAVSTSVKLSMAADKLSVLVPDSGAKVAISGLSAPVNQDFQGQKFLVYSGQNMAAGTEIQFKVEQLSNVKPQAAPAAVAAPAQSSASPGLIFGGIAIVLVAIGGAAVVLSRRKRLGSGALAGFETDAKSARSGDPIDLEAERRELVAAIARLDDLFEQDKVSSEEYGRLRTEKKRRLVEIVRMQKSGAATAPAGR